MGSIAMVPPEAALLLIRRAACRLRWVIYYLRRFARLQIYKAIYFRKFRGNFFFKKMSRKFPKVLNIA
jgi:hypothetical protein